MRLHTNLGVITIAMDQQNAPCAVASMRYLAGRHFFDGARCHRLTTKEIFILECGDPTGTGAGGPNYQHEAENLPAQEPGATTRAVYRRGTVAMANSGLGTTGSRFFIAYQDFEIDPEYTVLGVVASGLDIVDRVAAGGIQPYLQSTGDGTPNLGPVLNSVTVTP
jgi:peptidyl-prolyl cis-trans isomerase B (cyclophilin B)